MTAFRAVVRQYFRTKSRLIARVPFSALRTSFETVCSGAPLAFRALRFVSGRFGTFHRFLVLTISTGPSPSRSTFVTMVVLLLKLGNGFQNAASLTDALG